MIPNAVASTGPNAELWSHLKSLDHALERALSPSVSQLTELDRDRLEAVVGFLSSSLTQVSAVASPSLSNLSHATLSDENYLAMLDVRQKILSSAAFENWQRASKKGPDVKLQRLLKATEAFLATGELFKRSVPREEFEVIRSIINALLSDVETALY
jgi:hypothetical protein